MSEEQDQTVNQVFQQNNILPSMRMTYKQGTADFTTHEVVIESIGESSDQVKKNMEFMLKESKKILPKGCK